MTALSNIIRRTSYAVRRTSRQGRWDRSVYGIVQQSGGSIRVESAPGRGTTFRIDLPRCADQEGTARHEAARLPPTGGSETVLLVEDDDRVRALVATMLRGRGYTVLAADGGETALGIVQAQVAKVDLLLTDVVMPGMNGRALAERLQGLSPATRVLFMSIGRSPRRRPTIRRQSCRPTTPSFRRSSSNCSP